MYTHISSRGASLSAALKLHSNSSLQVQKSYLLKYIARLEAFPADQETSSSAFLELHISNTTFTSETRKAFQMPSTLLVEVVGSIYLFCKYALFWDRAWHATISNKPARPIQ